MIHQIKEQNAINAKLKQAKQDQLFEAVLKQAQNRKKTNGKKQTIRKTEQ